jgi:hypothetical protein
MIRFVAVPSHPIGGYNSKNCRGYAIQKYSTLHRKFKHILPEMKLRGLIHNFHILVSVSDLYIPMIGLQTNRWEYINRSQINECANWETEHFNSVLEITVSFRGIHNSEPSIYSVYWILTGPSFAVHQDLEMQAFMKGFSQVCL